MPARRPPRNKDADHAVAFISNLTLTGDYSGRPFRLRQWQARIIREIFGRKNKHGHRQYQRALLLLPRKHGKTELAAAILIYCLLGLPQSGQQIVSAATSRKQAALIFERAEQMIRADAFLSQLCEIVPSRNRIVVPHKHSFYQALAAESTRSSNLGLNPSVLLFDEISEVTDRKFYDKLTTSFGARKEPLTVMIGTGGGDKSSIGYEQFEYAKRVQQGVIEDPQFFPCLYYANDDDDWGDERVWRRVMPALGDFVELDYIRTEYRQAKELPQREAAFRAYFLNQFPDEFSTWIPDEVWQRNDAPPLKQPETIYTAGLDMASVKDTNALTLYGRNDDGTFDVIPFIWCCDSQINARKGSQFNYPGWVQQGYIRRTEGESTDHQQLHDDILEICSQYNVRMIFADAYGAQHWLAPKLAAAGLPLQYCHQTTRYLSEPLKELERQALAGDLRHGRNPVLRWHLSNCSMRADANGNYLVNKSKSLDQTDGIQALAMAIAAWQALHATNDTRSIYEDRGLVFV
jgi:phage terminase large subunit-like protein